MPLTTDQEITVTITAVAPYGSEADANGTPAFIDLPSTLPGGTRTYRPRGWATACTPWSWTRREHHPG